MARKILFFALLLALALSLVVNLTTVKADGNGGNEPTPASGQTYQIQPGDWFTKIDDWCNVHWGTTQSLNPKVDPKNLVKGQTINVPCDVKAVRPADGSDIPRSKNTGSSVVATQSTSILPQTSSGIKPTVTTKFQQPGQALQTGPDPMKMIIYILLGAPVAALLLHLMRRKHKK